MAVFVLIKRVDQSDYTEPHYYCQAGDTGEIVGVFSTLQKAIQVKSDMENLKLQEEEDVTYYEVEEHEVK